MACGTCCPVARGLMLSVLFAGVTAVASGLILSNQSTNLPQTNIVTPVAPETTASNSEDLNPVITTRDWQPVDTKIGRGQR